MHQGKELVSRWVDRVHLISRYIRINATSLTFRAEPTWTTSLTKGQYAPIYWSVRYGKWGNPWSSCFLSVTSEWIKLVALAGLSIVLLVNNRTWGMKQYSCTKGKNDQSHLKFTFSESLVVLYWVWDIFLNYYTCFCMSLILEWLFDGLNSKGFMGESDFDESGKKNSAAQI